jgi:VanZ family protein
VKLFLRYWLPLLVWVALIFVGSTDLMSAEHTSRFVVPFLRWLDPTISAETLMQVHFYLRKAAHVSEYAVLAALLYRALVNTLLLGRAMVSTIVVLLFCGIYAASDEFHQSFVPSRTATVHDIAIDGCGAIVGVLLIQLLRREPVRTRT